MMSLLVLVPSRARSEEPIQMKEITVQASRVDALLPAQALMWCRGSPRWGWRRRGR